MTQHNKNKSQKTSNTLAETDVVPVVPEDQVLPNGMGNAAQKAKNAETAPE